ncbi:MAG: ComF family protein [Bacteroidetes bacterium]|nr:MAG: ComF family protein [Bacteroidota bacterium]
MVGLPSTNYHLIADNPFERHFWGRVRIEAGAALYYFVPEGRAQTLLHNIKYRRRSDYAIRVGQIYGQQLTASPRFHDISAIIPVPLHWQKLRKRGFNQSKAFAIGLSESMGVPLDHDTLIRKRSTSTQTRKSRSERILNMADAFGLKNVAHLEGKSVLLVDDVLTTGATLEACTQKLLEIPGLNVSLATIACGRI